MKGLVFTEFLDFVTDQFGVDDCERMIEACDLPNGGAYTAVGTYDYRELVAMVIDASQHHNLPVPTLLKSFGRALFPKLITKYPEFAEGVPNSFELLKQIEEVIHVNVRKLYPDAELPSFTYEQTSENELRMVYESLRCLADVAEGLMLGCCDHYAETVSITREDLSDDAGSKVLFILTRSAA